MQERTTDTVGLQAESAKDVLTEILREGAHKMLATAIEAEVDAYVDEHADQRDANGQEPGGSQRSQGREADSNGHRPGDGPPAPCG